jgi:ABC-2 type transport system permease protein
MIRLVGAEVNRLLSRRLTLILTLAVLAVVALFQIAVVQGVTPPSAEQVAAARQGYEQDRKDWQENHEAMRQQCLAQGYSEDECVIAEPTESDYGLTPTPFDQIVKLGVGFSAAAAVLAGFLLAASFIGAEYSSGSLGNWLTFVPRRDKVYAAKVAALAMGAVVLGILTELLMVGAAVIITSIIGQPLTGIGGVVAMAARSIPAVVFAALVGFCIAMLTRHTVAALGVLLGYGLLVLGLNIVTYLVPTLGVLKRWQLETNIQAFVAHGYTYTTYRRTVTAQGVSLDPVDHVLSFGAASAYLAIVLIALLTLTLLVFRRRDVT